MQVLPAAGTPITELLYSFIVTCRIPAFIDKPNCPAKLAIWEFSHLPGIPHASFPEHNALLFPLSIPAG